MKVPLSKACIEPILLCSVQTLNQSVMKHIDGCYSRLLQKSLGWKFRDRKTLEKTYGGIKMPCEMRYHSKGKAKVIGHCPWDEAQSVEKLVCYQAANPLRKGQGYRYTVQLNYS